MFFYVGYYVGFRDTSFGEVDRFLNILEVVFIGE